MAALLWPDSLFGRLAIILFSGLVVAHVLAFVWIALDHMAIEEELGNKFAAVDIAEAVAILDYVEPRERPAWLDRVSRLHYRYFLRGGGELETDLPKRRQANIARLRSLLAPGQDANFVYPDPPARRTLLMHLSDGSPVTLEIYWPGASISPWLPAALGLQLCIIAFFVWLAVKRIQILAAISHDLQTPITRMRLRADFLGDSDAKERLQGDLRELQTLVKQGLDLAREYDDIGPPTSAHVAVEASPERS
ncbi:hypothetical protein CQ12_29595 [Bradyrhizobium jicamae]|uniref:histidine kinase n=2 Tax=Bradyrhizobium jicamae TaxID=280332 RepID=A0A0R3KYJ6_9BRAD|nr:hypothetical protein CQ12_29595 [Bradyrhizobium jicamae]